MGILFFGGPRLQPREELPKNYKLPEGVRPWVGVELDEDSAALTTYLLHPEGAMSEPLRHFIDRAQRVGHMPLDTQRLA